MKARKAEAGAFFSTIRLNCQAAVEHHNIDLELVKVRCTGVSLPSNPQKPLRMYGQGHQFLSGKSASLGFP